MHRSGWKFCRKVIKDAYILLTSLVFASILCFTVAQMCSLLPVRPSYLAESADHEVHHYEIWDKTTFLHFTLWGPEKIACIFVIRKAWSLVVYHAKGPEFKTGQIQCKFICIPFSVNVWNLLLWEQFGSYIKLQVSSAVYHLCILQQPAISDKMRIPTNVKF
jgi:hypothetical protein